LYGNIGGVCLDHHGNAVPAATEDFDRQFTIVVSGAERTRGVLYFFFLVLIVGIVFFFEDAFNTTGRRLEIMNGANACLGKKLAPAGAVPLSGYDGALCDFHYRYVRDHYQINIPPSPEAADMDEQAKTAFAEKYKSVLRDATDSLSTTVPILNVKIDRNTGLILQNSLGVMVLFVLLLSLRAERISLVTMREMIGGAYSRQENYFRARSVLDTHVFSRISAGQIFLFWVLFAPTAMQSYRIYQDFFVYFKTVMEVYGYGWGFVYLACEGASLALVLFVGFRCFREAKALTLSLDHIEQQVGVKSAADANGSAT
jgi:hypothetical protein